MEPAQLVSKWSAASDFVQPSQSVAEDRSPNLPNVERTSRWAENKYPFVHHVFARENFKFPSHTDASVYLHVFAVDLFNSHESMQQKSAIARTVRTKTCKDRVRTV